MAIASPFTITFGDYVVGGTSEFLLHNPYQIDKSYNQFRLAFEIVITATSYENLHELSDELEEGFRKRLTKGQKLIIDLDGTSWEYVIGEDLLQCQATISKSGSVDADRGFSRSYTVSIQGELPADQAQDGGLREVEVNVLISASRRKTVTMRGTYTATAAGDALDRYKLTFDSKASAYLTLIDAGAAWELVDESYVLDREQGQFAPEPHIVTFNRQYSEIVFDQSLGVLNDNAIVDHRVTFSTASLYPGDSLTNLLRMQRVNASFECSLNLELGTTGPLTFESKIKPLLIETFRSTFQPQVMAIEEERVIYDETSNRLSANLGFLYQPIGAQDIVEIEESVTYREIRTIDYTPIHGSDELAFYADPGWTTLERIWTRTIVKLGEESPSARLSAGSSGQSRNVSFSQRIGGISAPDARTAEVNALSTQGGSGVALGASSDGWNMISNTSQMTPRNIGLPGQEQIQLATINETIVERFNNSPGGGGSPGFPRWRGGTP